MLCQEGDTLGDPAVSQKDILIFLPSEDTLGRSGDGLNNARLKSGLLKGSFHLCSRQPLFVDDLVNKQLDVRPAEIESSVVR